jgi:cell division protein FtsW (lipid II flippase)
MSGPANGRAGRVQIIVGVTILAIGLIALSPVLSLAIATFFGSLFGVYVVNIEIRPGAVPVLLMMTAAGTAAVVGGAWIIATGYRRKRNFEPSGDLK